MTVGLNEPSYEHVQKLIKNRQCVVDDGDKWSEHRPSRNSEKKLILEHGVAEYRKWHLGEDDEESDDIKSRHKVPYGDFHKVHRCADISAESCAGQYKYLDIQLAATQFARNAG
jgi:hypothetical protein